MSWEQHATSANRTSRSGTTNSKLPNISISPYPAINTIQINHWRLICVHGASCCSETVDMISECRLLQKWYDLLRPDGVWNLGAILCVVSALPALITEALTDPALVTSFRPIRHRHDVTMPVIGAWDKITRWGQDKSKAGCPGLFTGAGAHNLLESRTVEPSRVDYIPVSCIYSFYTTRICISNYINNIHCIEYLSILRHARLHSQQTMFSAHHQYVPLYHHAFEVLCHYNVNDDVEVRLWLMPNLDHNWRSFMSPTSFSWIPVDSSRIHWNPLEYLSKFGRENVNIPVESSGMEFLIECQLDSTSLQEESMPVDSTGFYWISLESREIQCNTIKSFYFIYSLV